MVISVFSEQFQVMLYNEIQLSPGTNDPFAKMTNIIEAERGEILSKEKIDLLLNKIFDGSILETEGTKNFTGLFLSNP